MFKIGDKVIVTASDSELNDIGATNLKTGYVGVITYIGGLNSDYKIEIDDLHRGWLSEDMMELYNPQTDVSSVKDVIVEETTILKIKKTIKNDNVIVVFWNDGTKTVVKRGVNEVNDLEKAAMAICAKKLFGSYSKFKEGMGELFEVEDVKLDNTTFSNKIQCNHCNDIIESLHRHDFKWCSCKSVSVDGGKAYLKRNFINSPKDYTELSIFE